MSVIIWGRRQGLKKIADAGIMKCDRCGQLSTFEVEEFSKKATLYFVPIAKWGSKVYLVCTKCQNGFEIKDEKRAELAEAVAKLPDNKTSVAIYNKMDTLFVSFVESLNGDRSKLSGWNQYVTTELAKFYREDSVNYVLGVFNNNLLANNKKEVPQENPQILTEPKGKFCRNCGGKLDVESKFCGDCGNPIT